MENYKEYIAKTNEGHLHSSLCTNDKKLGPRQAARKIVHKLKLTHNFRVKVYDDTHCFEFTVIYRPEEEVKYLITANKRIWTKKTEHEQRSKVLKEMQEIDSTFTYPDNEWSYYEKI